MNKYEISERSFDGAHWHMPMSSIDNARILMNTLVRSRAEHIKRLHPEWAVRIAVGPNTMAVKIDGSVWTRFRVHDLTFMERF